MKRNNGIPPLFNFGVPLNQAKAKFEQNRFRANSSSKVRCPLSKLKDLLTSGSMIDCATLKNLLPPLFQVEKVGSARKNARRKAKKSSTALKNKPTRRVCIDVAKLDEISCLSTGEKDRIKNILCSIQCNSETHKAVTTKVITKKKKARTFKRATRSYAKEDLATPSDTETAPRNVKKLRASVSTASGLHTCPDCIGKSQLRVTRSPPTDFKSTSVKMSGLNATSQEQLLQALINLDPDSYGDTLKKQIGQPVNAMQPNRINITNLKVKYVNPTYVVQYNGEDKPPELARDRFYSNVALESHLGKRPALSVRDDRKDRQSMHYEDSMPHVVGMGMVTEQMLRERSDTLEDRVNSLEDQKARSERAPWQRESIPGYLKPPTPATPTPAPTLPTPPDPKETHSANPTAANSSRCQRLLVFVRRVLCMSGGEETTGAKKPRTDGDVKTKRKVTIADAVEVEPPCVRTTKSQFFRVGPKN